MIESLKFFILALATLVLAACTDETPTYRYRMTVEVETPQGLKTGSSVIEVDTRLVRPGSAPAGGAVNQSIRGQAAAVDLGKKRILFALLRSEDDVDYAGRIMFLMAPEGQDADGDDFLGRYANMLAMTDAIELPDTLAQINPSIAHMSGRPMLVTFGNLADPTSVTRVNPDDLAASFGEGVKLKRITVQMTDDQVTNGIEKRLSWLRAIKKMKLRRNQFPDDVPVGDFSRMFRDN